MIKVAIVGAAGKMGKRISAALRDDSELDVTYVVSNEAGEKVLADSGLTATPMATALSDAAVVLMAVPDNKIDVVSREVVPLVPSGALIACLDPAAPYAGELPERDDVSYFVMHPSHPPIFNDEVDMDARRDFFGSGKAKQAVVCALMQGPEDAYALGEKIAAKAFGPILRTHRVTVEQMAILEPALSETVAATCLTAIREGLDEAVGRGVPYEAARDFVMGHLNAEIAIIFNEVEFGFSDGAKKAIAEAMPELFKSDWKSVFTDEKLKASVDQIVNA